MFQQAYPTSNPTRSRNGEYDRTQVHAYLIPGNQNFQTKKTKQNKLKTYNDNWLFVNDRNGQETARRGRLSVEWVSLTVNTFAWYAWFCSLSVKIKEKYCMKKIISCLSILLWRVYIFSQRTSSVFSNKIAWPASYMLVSVHVWVHV